MKVIRITTHAVTGGYTNHGIGYTEHDGYAGTGDNRMSIKSAIAYEMRCFKPGESYMIEINGKSTGPHTKPVV